MAIRALDKEVQTVIDDLIILLEPDPEAFPDSAISEAMQMLYWGKQAITGIRGQGSTPTASLSEPDERMLWQTAK